MRPDAGRLDVIFRDCLFRSDEIVDRKTPADAVIVDGLVNKYGLHPGRLEGYRAEVVEMLEALPDEFHSGTGGGWSFLNLCRNKVGDQWADEHRTCEQLVVLGIGLGYAKYLTSRQTWEILPGGVPYITINLEGLSAEEHHTAPSQ